MKQFSAIAQTFILTSFSALSLLAISPVEAASFAGLGAIYSPSGISADGSVIVGTTGNEAFRWTQSSGAVGLGFLADDHHGSIATDVSADGSVIVGGSYTMPSFRISPFRWTQETGMVGLGSYPDEWFGWYDLANGVSADGSVIVGRVDGTTRQAFRWTQSSGIVGLGDLAGGIFDSTATDISADGSTVQTGWVAPNDGLLVVDRNLDNVINDGSELFGTSTILKNGLKAIDGYQALSEFDSDGDGLITNKDSEFNKLGVWVDSNSNALN
jgi:probable HAF family extracellular repeat protein